MKKIVKNSLCVLSMFVLHANIHAEGPVVVDNNQADQAGQPVIDNNQTSKTVVDNNQSDQTEKKTIYSRDNFVNPQNSLLKNRKRQTTPDRPLRQRLAVENQQSTGNSDQFSGMAEVYKESPLVTAVKENDFNAVQELIKGGADINMRDSKDKIAYDYALENSESVNPVTSMKALWISELVKPSKNANEKK